MTSSAHDNAKSCAACALWRPATARCALLGEETAPEHSCTEWKSRLRAEWREAAAAEQEYPTADRPATKRNPGHTF